MARTSPSTRTAAASTRSGPFAPMAASSSGRHSFPAGRLDTLSGARTAGGSPVTWATTKLSSISPDRRRVGALSPSLRPAHSRRISLLAASEQSRVFGSGFRDAVALRRIAQDLLGFSALEVSQRLPGKPELLDLSLLHLVTLPPSN